MGWLVRREGSCCGRGVVLWHGNADADADERSGRGLLLFGRVHMLLLERNRGTLRESVRKTESEFWTIPLLRPWRIARVPLLVVVVRNHSSAAHRPQRDGRRLACSTSFSDRCAFRGDVVLPDISGLGSSSRCLFVSRKSADEATYISCVCSDGLIMRSWFTAVDCKRKEETARC